MVHIVSYITYKQFQGVTKRPRLKRKEVLIFSKLFSKQQSQDEEKLREFITSRSDIKKTAKESASDQGKLEKELNIENEGRAIEIYLLSTLIPYLGPMINSKWIIKTITTK